MNTLKITALAVVIVFVSLSSCVKSSIKNTNINSQSDSLAYSLGVINATSLLADSRGEGRANEEKYANNLANIEKHLEANRQREGDIVTQTVRKALELVPPYSALIYEITYRTC